MKICLDMDQPLCDWNFAVGSLLAARHGTTAVKIAESLDAGVRFAQSGYDGDYLRKALEEAGAEWWATLPSISERFPNCPGFLELYAACREYTPEVYILTAAKTGAAADGKVQWLRKHIDGFDDYIIVAHAGIKQHFAQPGRVLLDDFARSCREWEEQGGYAELFVPSLFSLDAFRDRLDVLARTNG